MFHLLVTGDREWSNEIAVRHIFDFFSSNISVMHGWARGLDSIVDKVAHERNMHVLRRPSHWKHNDKLWVEIHGPCSPFCKEIIGRATGVIRNGAMLKEHQPHLLLAFHNNLDQSTGTKDMVRRARKKVPTILITDTNYKQLNLREVLDKLDHDVSTFFNY
jgi:hypothetical protein